MNKELKFKVGDWICQGDYVMKIDSITDYAYHSNDRKAIKLENAKLWIYLMSTIHRSSTNILKDKNETFTKRRNYICCRVNKR
jgi:hypothetical protein